MGQPRDCVGVFPACSLLNSSEIRGSHCLRRGFFLPALCASQLLIILSLLQLRELPVCSSGLKTSSCFLSPRAREAYSDEELERPEKLRIAQNQH